MSHGFDAIGSIGSVARLFVGNMLYRRALSRLMSLLAMTMVASLMGTVLVIAGFYGIWRVLLTQGVTPDKALVVVVAAAALLTLVLVACICRSVQRLKGILLPKSLSSRVSHITDAFVDGFMEEPVHHHPPREV